MNPTLQAIADVASSFAGRFGFGGRTQASAVPGDVASVMALATTPFENLIAPAPAIDKYPIIIGSNITLNYIAAASRIALTGYRYQIVDLLDEMLDHEPHGYACLSKRILTVAGARMEVSPAECADADKEKAQELADLVSVQVKGIPFRSQRFAQILWGTFYGLSGQEIEWEREAGGWRAVNLHFLHSRRLSFPDYNSWDPYIYDQGGQVGLAYENGRVAMYGRRIADYPGKFIVHAPSLRGNYPTREGLGRILLTYWAIKRLVVRVSAQDFERFIKPWAVAYYNKRNEAGKEVTAHAEDIKSADAAIRALGAGSLAGVTLPDTVKIELLKAMSELSQGEFLEFLDSATSKAVLGQAHTMQSGKYGSKSTAEVGKDETLQLLKFDADCLADTLRECLFRHIVRLNAPGLEHLTPTVKFHVDDPDPTVLLNLATTAAASNIHVDGDRVAASVGLPVIPRDDGVTLPRRMVPLKAVGLGETAESAEVSAIGMAAKVADLGLQSPTLTKLARSHAAAALAAEMGADAATITKIQKEIDAAVTSEVEMREIANEAEAERAAGKTADNKGGVEPEPPEGPAPGDGEPKPEPA